jgi:Carboxypeptidase regulatory-like domain
VRPDDDGSDVRRRLLLQGVDPCTCSHAPKAAQAPSTPPTLLVRTVDRTGEPILGAQVQVTPHKRDGRREVALTGVDGYATFWLPRGIEYRVVVRLEGFKKAKQTVFLSPEEGAVPTELQLSLTFSSGPRVTVY